MEIVQNEWRPEIAHECLEFYAEVSDEHFLDYGSSVVMNESATDTVTERYRDSVCKMLFFPLKPVKQQTTYQQSPNAPRPFSPSRTHGHTKPYPPKCICTPPP